jgi:hypothetical protein
MAAADAVAMTFIVIVAVKLCVPEKAARLIHGTSLLLGQRRARYAELRAVTPDRPPSISGHPQAGLTGIAQGLTGQPCT